MRSHLAIDIGGTQMRAACFLENEQKAARLQRIATQGANRTPLENLVHLIEAVWLETCEVQSIGLAVPGPIDLPRRQVITTPNIPEWRDFPLPDILEERFKVPVAFDNDANLAALGEWNFGVGHGHSHLVYITVSTGIGGGILVDNQLLHGVRGLAAELGHVTVVPDGPLCGCGLRGHLEAVASGTAIARMAREGLARHEHTSLVADPPPNARQVAEAAEQGDPLSQRIMAYAGKMLGVALADFLHIFNPSILILGGGVSHSGETFWAHLRQALQQHTMSAEYSKNLVIAQAALGDEAGLMGALALARSISQAY